MKHWIGGLSRSTRECAQLIPSHSVSTALRSASRCCLSAICARGRTVVGDSAGARGKDVMRRNEPVSTGTQLHGGVGVVGQVHVRTVSAAVLRSLQRLLRRTGHQNGHRISHVRQLETTQCTVAGGDAVVANATPTPSAHIAWSQFADSVRLRGNGRGPSLDDAIRCRQTTGANFHVLVLFGSIGVRISSASRLFSTLAAASVAETEDGEGAGKQYEQADDDVVGYVVNWTTSLVSRVSAIIDPVTLVHAGDASKGATVKLLLDQTEVGFSEVGQNELNFNLFWRREGRVASEQFNQHAVVGYVGDRVPFIVNFDV